jgi:hypothetical protein
MGGTKIVIASPNHPDPSLTLGMTCFYNRGDAESRREQELLQDQMRVRGVEPVTFLPCKGEVFFWHAALYHGGEPIRDPARTRKSYVVHYSTRRSHRELLRDGNATGFTNPLAASDRSWGPTVRERLAAFRDRLFA